MYAIGARVKCNVLFFIACRYTWKGQYNNIILRYSEIEQFMKAQLKNQVKQKSVCLGL
jgi:hypothetical protein